MRVLTITDGGVPVAMSCDERLIAVVARVLVRDALDRQDGTKQGALDAYVRVERLADLAEPA
jgi:hypothetical protein